MALAFQVRTLSLFKDRTSPQQFKGQSCVSSDASTPADIVLGTLLLLVHLSCCGRFSMDTPTLSPRGILGLQLRELNVVLCAMWAVAFWHPANRQQHFTIPGPSPPVPQLLPGTDGCGCRMTRTLGSPARLSGVCNDLFICECVVCS